MPLRARRLALGAALLATIAGLSITTLACGSLGTRARAGCPAGEVCNPDTPNGLRFFGASLAGSLANAPSAVAIGGHEAISFEDASAIPSPLPAHHVVSTDPTHVSVTSSGGGTAALVGVATGSASLRVLDASERLIDALTVSAGRLDHVEVIPTDDLLIALAPQPTPPVVFAAGTRHLGFALRDAAGGRLVDDQMRVTTTGAFMTTGWDTVDATLAGSDLVFTITSGGARFDATAHLAGAIDDFVLAAWLLPMDAMGHPLVGVGDSLCFLPSSRGALVVGSTTPFGFTVDGHAVTPDATGVCVALPTGLGAQTVVVVSLGTATHTFTLAVDPARRTTAMPLVAPDLHLPRFTQSQLGVRALSVRGLDAL